MPSTQMARERRRAIEAEKRESRRQELDKCHTILGGMWYGSWILMIGSGAALFIAKSLIARLIFGGLIGLGITTAVCAASWALIIGTATA